MNINKHADYHQRTESPLWRHCSIALRCFKRQSATTSDVLSNEGSWTENVAALTRALAENHCH